MDNVSFKFKARVALIGVEYKPAYKGFFDKKTGETSEGGPARYCLAFLLGTKNESTGLYTDVPTVCTVTVSLGVGSKITEGGEYDALLQSKNGYPRILEIDGIEIVKKDNTADNKALPF